MKNQPDEQALTINGRSLKITHLQKIFFPESRYTKYDLIQYYRRISKLILPYLIDRPESLHRFPDGIRGNHFFQKNVGDRPPSWVKTKIVHSEHENHDVRYVLCQDEAALVYLINLGCIELNPWNSRIKKLDYPDFLILDLDPEDISFDKVVEAAKMLKELLDEIGAFSICKTSGATGLHIYVPLGAHYTYDDAKTFAEIVANIGQKRLPHSTSVLRMPNKRQKKVYLDFLQNRKGQTLAAPYSVRPRPFAPVSAPLEWKEVKKGLDPNDFTIANIEKRVSRIGDLWKPILSKSIDLKKSLKRLERLS